MSYLRSILLLSVVFVAGSAIAAEQIEASQYLVQLKTIREHINNEQFAQAKEAAQNLSGFDISYDGVVCPADTDLLGNVTKTPSRLDALIQALESLDTNNELSSPPDTALANKIRDAQELHELARGGLVSTLPDDDTGILEWLYDKTSSIMEWITELLENIFSYVLEMLYYLFGGAGGGKGANATSYITNFLIGAVIVVFVLLLVYLIRNKAAMFAKTNNAPPVMSIINEDDDVLTRDTEGWDKYATELMAKGQYRSAIRAYYNAILTKAFRAGCLHYRKGRTNWEYVSAIAFDANWRSTFIVLVQKFEREWYGGALSTYEGATEYAKLAKEVTEQLRPAKKERVKQ